MNILQELRNRFASVLRDYTDAPEPFLANIKLAQDQRFGDYQANFCMALGKQRGVAPPVLAAEIISRVDVNDLCSTPEVAGPGFINLRIRQDRLAELTNTQARDPRCGVKTATQPKRVIVDYSSPNVAKPMHVGHLRSTVIGDALYRVLKFLGHDVTSDNHLGDWGTQFGMIIYGYKNFLNADNYSVSPVTELARLYRLVNQLEGYHEAVEQLPTVLREIDSVQVQLDAAHDSLVPTEKKEQDQRKKLIKSLTEQFYALAESKADFEKKIAIIQSDAPRLQLAQKHPNIAADARLETARLHNGDPENTRLWNQFMPECLAALQRMYDRLGVRFDMTLGESHYQPMLAAIVDELTSKGLVGESDGAICRFVDGIKGAFIVRKSDGAYTYATTDLATIRDRVDRLKTDLALYVVDSRQADHFIQLINTARAWGYGTIDLQHVKFGTIMGDDRRPYKTRSGDTVGLESLIDEAIQRARKIVDESDDRKSTGAELDEESRASIAEAVGIGAIKYADLSQNRETDYIFSWDKMLALTGDTATYMQYAYARVCGIFRRGGIDRAGLRNSSVVITLDHPAERALAFQLARFQETLEAVLGDYRPNLLTAYLYDTANCFSTFFENCPVLKAETATQKESRSLLADLTARVLEQGLNLLGIKTIEKM